MSGLDDQDDDEFAAAFEELPAAAKMCRDIGHAWTFLGDKAVPHEGSKRRRPDFLRTFYCLRECGVTKWQLLDPNGYIIDTGHDYGDSNYLILGLGRFSKERRARVRQMQFSKRWTA